MWIQIQNPHLILVGLALCIAAVAVLIHAVASKRKLFDAVIEAEEKAGFLDKINQMMSEENVRIANRANRYRDTLERVYSDTVLDRQTTEYYKRIIRVHSEWIVESLKEPKP